MSLEIVIPAHNEQHRIDRTLTAYRDHLVGADLTITVALDDCTDSTAEIVARHSAEDSRVRAVCYPRLGKGGVLTEAFRATTADLVAFVDADCATPPAEVEVLAETVQQTGADIAIASRWHPSSVVPRPRRLGRRLASVGFARAVRTLFGLPFTDTQCGAKVLTREAVQRLVPLLSSRDFVFDVDLLLTARGLEMQVAEVPTVWIDQDGSRIQLGYDALKMAASLGRLWLHHQVMPVRMPAAAVHAMPAALPATPLTPALISTDGHPAGAGVGAAAELSDHPPTPVATLPDRARALRSQAVAETEVLRAS